ncbi:hypothetical protein KBJ94_23345 [Pseudomonas sp. ITA]|uniref:hypothetical protein n=1 Tax=Pseudomonas sp. ITA TaxID=2825841 RepID=UPI0024968A79|nr:hypothetical protein [Pseudomonas sp. ITA]MDI2144989.1 hypothetical protein [Pseudomonas sp. ITA]
MNKGNYHRRRPAIGAAIIRHLVYACFFYFVVGDLVPTLMRRQGMLEASSILSGVGVAIALFCAVRAILGGLRWVRTGHRWQLKAIFSGFSVDPREDLRKIPALKGELSESKKVELLALTKISKGWGELEDELKVRGFRMVPHSRDLCLATLDSNIEVLCTMSSLGVGSSYESLCKRLGAPPDHLVPLRRAI